MVSEELIIEKFFFARLINFGQILMAFRMQLTFNYPFLPDFPMFPKAIQISGGKLEGADVHVQHLKIFLHHTRIFFFKSAPLGK